MKADQLTDWIKFINADCMEIMAQYPDKYFDLAIVDPPYGIRRAGQTERFTKSRKHKRKYYELKDWDNSTPDYTYFKELKRVSCHQVIWGANYYTKYLSASMGWIFWDKGQEGLSMSDGELAYTSFARALRKVVINRFEINKDGAIHPTQKPVKLYEWIYHNYAKPEFKILDTHLGSGSNAIAAHNYGISEFVGIELDPEYYADSIKRFNRVTSQLRMF